MGKVKTPLLFSLYSFLIVHSWWTKHRNCPSPTRLQTRLPPCVQFAVLLLRQAALFRSGQCGPPAPGLSAHAGALRDVPGNRDAHWDVCPGNHRSGAPGQRSASTRKHKANVLFQHLNTYIFTPFCSKPKLLMWESCMKRPKKHLVVALVI